MKSKSVLQNSEEDRRKAAIARERTFCLARLRSLSATTNYLRVQAVSGVRVILYAAGTIES